MSFVQEAIANRRILLCVGPGGVGKTTSSASLALAAAQSGRRVLVVTVDPAKRLATSLGLHSLGPEQTLVDPALVQPRGEGALWAMMLDQKHAFDAVVAKHAKHPEAVKRILESPIYAQISGSLAGAHEYAAMAMLEELAKSDRYDLIVVDTPPSRHAVDFIDAPEKLAAFIDSPAIDWFRKLRPDSRDGGFSVLGRTGAFILGRLAKFVGNRFLQDLGVFITEFHDVLVGFRNQANTAYGLLRRPDVGVLVVSTPERYALADAAQLAAKLRTHGIEILGMIANRVHVSAPLRATEQTTREQLEKLLPPALAEQAWSHYAAVEAVAAAELDQLRRISKAFGHGVLCIAHAETDIVELGSLQTMAQWLLRAEPLRA